MKSKSINEVNYRKHGIIMSEAWSTDPNAIRLVHVASGKSVEVSSKSSKYANMDEAFVQMQRKLGIR